MPNPLLSVVIPAFNAEAYIAEAIESVLAQTYSPIEVIVVDNCSTDGTATVVQRFDGVRYLFEEVSGPAPARNTGIASSVGDYIGFLDADDRCRRDRFALQMECLRDYPRLGYSLARVQNFIEPGSNAPEFLRTPELMTAKMGFIASATVRRATFDRVGLFNPEYRIGEDVEWLMRAERAGIPAVVLIDVLVERRLHDSNISQNVKLGHKNLMRIIRQSLNDS